MRRYIQPTKAPTRKVAFSTLATAGGGTGGAVALIWAAGMFGLDIPMPVAVWLCAVIGAFAGGYFPTERMQGT